MKDGLYVVYHGTITAAFGVRDGKVVACAPVLRKKFDFFSRIAKWYPCNTQTRPIKAPAEELFSSDDV
jgi:hypothetical protein